MRNVQWTSGRKWTQTFIPPHPDPTHLTAKSIICSETACASEHKLYCHPAPPRPTNSSRCRKWVLQLCGSWVPVDSSFCRQFCLDFSRRAKLVLLFDCSVQIIGLRCLAKFVSPQSVSKDANRFKRNRLVVAWAKRQPHRRPKRHVDVCVEKNAGWISSFVARGAWNSSRTYP